MSDGRHTAGTGYLLELDDAVGELTDRDHLYARLRNLIPQQTTILESHIGARTRYSAAPIPWNTPAAMLYLDIHAAAREHESNLTLLLWKKATYRGPADALTTATIRRLPDLIRAAHNAGHTHHTVVTEATHDLTTWPTLIRRLLDEARSHETPWTRAPGNLRCTTCGHALYLAPGWQYDAEHADVICRTCRDDIGQHPRWKPSLWLGRLQTDTTTNDPRDPEHTITARDAVHIWGLSADQVYVWKHRGTITPVGTDRDGRDLYRNGDVATLVNATRPDTDQNDIPVVPA